MTKVLTVPNLTSEVLQMVLASKQILFIYNQKDYICNGSFDLLQIQIVALLYKARMLTFLNKELKKFTVIFFNFISFSLEKKYMMVLHLAVAFQQYQIH